MPSASPARPRSTLLTTVVLWAIFYASFALLWPPLLDDADSVHAEVAREMLARHDYVTLYANGIRYLEKAPLLYWALAACMRVAQALGHTSATALAVAARVPLALTVLALALVCEAFARRVFRSARAGLYATIILLSSPGIFLFTRILLPDAMVCLWLAIAIYAVWRMEELQSAAEASSLRNWCWIFAAACGLNVLTKGLIGIVFPIAIALIFLGLTRGLRGALARVRELPVLSSLLIFCIVTVPWHVLIALANPTEGHPGGLSFTLHPAVGEPHWSVPLPTDGNVHGWAWFYFVNEQVLRYLNLRVPHDYDTVPLWIFWGLCLIWLMPWSAFIFSAIARFIPAHLAAFRRALADRKLDLSMRAPLLLAIWGAFVLLFFLFSTRQEYYVLPALPAFAILIAGWLALDETTQLKPATQARTAARRATAVLVAVGAMFAVGAAIILLRSHPAVPGADLASLLQQNPSDYAMSMGHFLDLNAEALALFRIPLIIAAGSLLLGPSAAYVFRNRARPHAATLALAAGAFGFLLAVHLGLQTFAPIISSAELAHAIRQQIAAAPPASPEPLIVIHQEYEYGSTLGFYLQRPHYTFVQSPGPAHPVALDPIHILTEPHYNDTPNYGRSSNLWYGSFFTDAPQIFETSESLAAKWRNPQRIFLWQDLANEPAPPPALSPIYVVARSGGKEILSNQPNR